MTEISENARAEYLRQLERAMVLDPDPEYRAQAKAEYLKLTALRCGRCAGLGRVFVCRHWPRCHCTDDVIESDCPGHFATCPECGGEGNTRILSALTAGKPEQAVPSEAEAERERIAKALEEEADTTPCSEDAVVVRDCARLVRANFSYGEAERLASTTADIAAPTAGGGDA